MTRFSRDSWIAAGLILLLVVISGLAAVAQAQQLVDQPALANFSTQRDGGRALWLWLERLGYRTSDEVHGVFSIPAGTTLALVLEPQAPGLTEAEWEKVDVWVKKGGTLLLAGEGFGTAFAVDHYQFDIRYLDEGEAITAHTTPLLASPPPATLANARPRAALVTERTDFATLLAVESDPVLVAFPQGEGLVVLSTLAFPLSNAGLKDAGNPELALNLASLAGEGGRLWFDEWHHGRRGSTTEVAGPAQWLRSTPPGRAILYTVLVIFLALVLGGQRFGRPVPLPREQERRAPLEHIFAVANLNRRAGHRRAALAHYHQFLKRELGRRYRLPASLPDDDYVEQLAQYQLDLDRAALRQLLARLRATDVGEVELVQLAQTVAGWLDREK